MSYIGRTPTPAALTASDITDGIVSNAKLAQDIISADTALAVAPDDTDELLVSNSGVLNRIDYSLIKGGTNTPAFEAKLASSQTMSDNTNTKIELASETFDVGGCYDNSTNYRFLPTTAGKYFIYGKARLQADQDTDLSQAHLHIYQNGGNKIESYFLMWVNYVRSVTIHHATVIDMDGSTDYVELYANVDQITGTAPVVIGGAAGPTLFGAFKLIE